jgi:Fungal Zn(2)-Cys(6) binuclear cluster domain
MRNTSSCSLCRRRKIRCNRETPCSNCVRSKNQTCVYDITPPRQHGRGQTSEFGQAQKSRESIPIDRASSTSGGSTVPSHPSNSLPASSTSASTLSSQPSARDVESMKSRIRQPEEQQSRTTLRSTQSPVSPSNFSIEATTSRIGGTFYVHRENRLFGQPQAITRGVTHKTRTFGRSHWINGVALVSSIYRTLLDKWPNNY